MLRRLLPMITLLVVFPMVAMGQDKDKDAKKDEPKEVKKDEKTAPIQKPDATTFDQSNLPLAVFVANNDPNQRFYYWGMLILIFFTAINAVCLILLRSDIQALRSGGSNMSGS